MAKAIQSYSAGSFFGDLVNAAGNLGGKYLDFKWSNNRLDEERLLAQKYNAAVTKQAVVDTPRAEMSTSSMLKYGGMAIAGLVALMVVAKVLK